MSTSMRCPSWLCGYGWGEAGDEDVAELFVEDIGYPATVCVGDTIAVIETFDRVSALLLTVNVVVKQLRLTLTGPDNRCFVLADGVAHSCLDLFAHRDIECF